MIYGAHLGNDFPGLEHADGIPNPDIQLINKILVVQGCPLYLGTAKLHRLKNSRRGDAACAPYGKLNIQQPGFLFLRRILVSHRPLGHLGSLPQLLPLGKIIDLYHGTVNIIRQAAPGGPDFINSRHDLLSSTANLVVVNDLHALFFHEIIGFRMAGKLPALSCLQIEHEHGQLPFLGNAAVQLPEGTGSTIPGIGKKLQPQKLLTVIYLGKCLPAHVHLPPHLKVRQAVLQLLLYILDDTGIFRHILPLNYPVPPGNSLGEQAIAVAKGQGKAVNFFLHHKLRLIQCLNSGVHKIRHLCLGKNILQGKHRHIMLHQHPCLTPCRAAHLLGRRSLGNQLRVCPLQGFQPLHQQIILIITDFRTVIVIIAFIMMADFLPQPVQLLFDLRYIHLVYVYIYIYIGTFTCVHVCLCLYIHICSHTLTPSSMAHTSASAFSARCPEN